MNLSDVLKKIGDDNLRFQWLHDSMTNIKNERDGDTEVSFVTQQMQADDAILPPTERKQVAMVVWFDPDDFQKALEEATCK